MKKLRKQGREPLMLQETMNGFEIECTLEKENEIESISNIEELFGKGLDAIHLIPFDNPEEMLRLKKELKDLLHVCLIPDGPRFIVHTRNSPMNARTFIPKYIDNLFECSERLRIYYAKHPDILISDLPDFLYHGTTTKFLREIKKKGLLPSFNGRCWKENKREGVWLTDSLYPAEYFAIVAAQRIGGRPVILVINDSEFKASLKLGYEKFERDKLSFIDKYMQFLVEQPIPSNAIFEWYILPKWQSLFSLLKQISNHYLNKADQR